jgi:hypothetical protein
MAQKSYTFIDRWAFRVPSPSLPAAALPWQGGNNNEDEDNDGGVVLVGGEGYDEDCEEDCDESCDLPTELSWDQSRDDGSSGLDRFSWP